MLILGGQLTVNLERIHKDIARITSDNVDPGGSIDSQLGKDAQRHCKDYLWQCWSWGVDWQSTWKGSAKTLQGLPLTMLILGGLINSQLGKDPQRHCKDYLWQCWSWGGQSTVNLERICKDIAKITSDNVDPWGGQSTVNLERIRKNIARITSDNVDPGGSINSQLGKDPQRHCKDYLWQCWSGGQLTVNLERIRKDITRITSDNVGPGGSIDSQCGKGSAKTLQGLPLTMLILGVQSTVNLERIHEDIARITSDNIGPGGVDWQSTWKGSTKTLQWLPLTMLILGVDQQSTWKGSAKTLQGLPLTMLILGGLIDSQLGKDLQRHCKDYLWQCWSWGADRQSTCKGSAKTLQGLPLTMLILGGLIDSQLGKNPRSPREDPRPSHTSRVQHGLATSNFHLLEF